MDMMINRQQILSALEPLVVEEPVAALGGKAVRFRELSGAARDALYERLKDDHRNSAFEAALIAATVVDVSGSPLFDAQDVETLCGGRTALLEELAHIAMRANGLGARAHQDALKN